MRKKCDVVDALSHRIHWSLVLVLLTLLVAGGTATTAAPESHGDKATVRSDCQLFGGVYWETSDGYFGCSLPGGFVTECDASGNCTNFCYAGRGCSCEGHGSGAICVHAFTPGTSDDPWDLTQIDPNQKAKLPPVTAPSTTSPPSRMRPDDSGIVTGDQIMTGGGSSIVAGTVEADDSTGLTIAATPMSPVDATPVPAR